MPTIAGVTGPLRSIYRAVPPSGPGVCTVCHSQPGPGYDVCYSCHTAMSQVSHPVRTIVPISLMAKDGQLYFVLRHYKDAVTSVATYRFRIQVAGIIGRFLDDHRACIEAAAGRSWDAITIVPSTRNRIGPHPLGDAIRMLVPTGAALLETLRANPNWVGAEREADDERFPVIADVAGRLILIVDDTLTTGARVQSAASALRLAGATVVAAVPIGRLINPEHSPDVWSASGAGLYDFDVCCLESGRPPSGAVGPSGGSADPGSPEGGCGRPSLRQGGLTAPLRSGLDAGPTSAAAAPSGPAAAPRPEAAARDHVRRRP